MWMPNWLLRGEYRFADYGTFSNTDTRINPAGPTTQIASYDVRARTHTALFGIAYKFGAASVAARY
jgi:outer membrane immunogenic protein